MECACVALSRVANGGGGLFGECNAPVGQRFVAADGGDGFTVAVGEDGAVIGWGSAFYGELHAADAAGGEDDCVNRPEQLVRTDRDTPYTRLSVREECVSVACGWNHVLALSRTGRALAWGRNMCGQVADVAAELVYIPTVVAFPTESQPQPQLVALAAGGMHSLAVDTHGRAWGWGSNVYGQLGIDSAEDQCKTPTLLALSSGVQALHVAAGWAHSALVSTAGEAYTFGWGLYQQLGHGVTQNERRPTEVAALRGIDSAVVQMACGNWHTAALTASGDLYTWGWGTGGQLGHGDKVATQALPRVVAVSSDAVADEGDVLALACGPQLTLGLCRSGSVQWWGARPAACSSAVAVASGGCANDGQPGSEGVQTVDDAPAQSWRLRPRQQRQRVRKVAVGHSHACLLLSG